MFSPILPQYVIDLFCRYKIAAVAQQTLLIDLTHLQPFCHPNDIFGHFLTLKFSFELVYFILVAIKGFM